jgi:ribonuclease HI
MQEQLTVNTDGGARGNPGPAACAFVVSRGGKTFFKGSEFLGSATNNQAEYHGVIMALKYLSDSANIFPVKEIIFVLDSELVARQLSGIYKTKNPDLKKLLETAKLLERKIKAKIIYSETSRDKNKLADFLVNEELNRQEKISRH